MSSIANIDSYFAELCLKYWVPSFSFKVVGWLIEISNSRDMSFLLLPKDVSMVIDDNCWVLEGVFVFYSFEDGGNDDHVVFFGELLEHLTRLSIDRFGELDPRVPLSGANKERSSPDLLQAQDVDFFKSCQLNNILDSLHNCFLLLADRFVSSQHDLILNRTYLNIPLRANLFFLRVDSKAFDFNIEVVCSIDGLWR